MAEVMCKTGHFGGLIWCLAPLAALSGAIGGLLFAKQIRAAEYLTMIEPFQKNYGRIIGALFALVSICCEIMWTGAVFNAFGKCWYIHHYICTS
jgi:solute carrier family 5 (high affinity choline transporter), member 7